MSISNKRSLWETLLQPCQEKFWENECRSLCLSTPGHSTIVMLQFPTVHSPQAFERLLFLIKWHHSYHSGVPDEVDQLDTLSTEVPIHEMLGREALQFWSISVSVVEANATFPWLVYENPISSLPWLASQKCSILLVSWSFDWLVFRLKVNHNRADDLLLVHLRGVLLYLHLMRYEWNVWYVAGDMPLCICYGWKIRMTY